MEKKVTIGEKEYTIKQMKYIQAVELENAPKPEIARNMLKFSVGLTDEEVNELSLEEGLQLQKEVNEVNGIGKDFQKPTESKTS